MGISTHAGLRLSPYCARCGALVGSVEKWDGPLRFCSTECLTAGPAGHLDIRIGWAEARQAAAQMHAGGCAECGRPGPVDVCESYRIWSVVLWTTWNKRATVCCFPCARRRWTRDAVFCLLLGWWGIPVGVCWTPVQVYRNIASLRRANRFSSPSDKLAGLVAAQMYEERLHTALEQYAVLNPSQTAL